MLVRYMLLPVVRSLSVIHLFQTLSNAIFVQLRSSWQVFSWHRALRGPSAIAEFLVTEHCISLNNVQAMTDWLIELRLYVPLDTEYKTFIPDIEWP